MVTEGLRLEHRVPTRVPRGRRVVRELGLPSGRAVLGGLLMALAAVLTFVAQQGFGDDDAIAVAIATSDLPAGHVLSPSDLRMVPVELPDDVRGLFGSVDAATGRQLLAPVQAGAFLQAGATATATGGDEALEVGITVPATRAVGGLRAGERVDVFATWGGDVTELIAVDARVLAVVGTASVLGSSEHVTLRLAVADFGQVEALVHGQAAGDLTVIRAALGSEVEDLGRDYRPLERRSDDTEDRDEDDS